MILNKAILIEILKTYPDAEEIEKVYNEPVKKPKKLTKTRWEQLYDMTSDALKKTKEKTSEALGYNTKIISWAGYLTIRNYISIVCDHNDPKALAELLWVSGLIAHVTRMTSPNYGSELSKSAYALRAYILYKIKEKLDSPHKKERFAAQLMKQAIEQRIENVIKSIRFANALITLNKELKLGVTLVNNSILNGDRIRKIEEALSEEIDICYTHLYFLGNNEATDYTLKTPQDLFPYYSYYNQKEFKLDGVSVKNIDHTLPVALQPIFIAVHLREKTDLGSEKSDITVIETFEKRIISRLEKEKKAKVNMPSFSPETLSLGLDIPENLKDMSDSNLFIPSMDNKKNSAEDKTASTLDKLTPSTRAFFEGPAAEPKTPKKEEKMPDIKEIQPSTPPSPPGPQIPISTYPDDPFSDEETNLEQENNPDMTKSYVNVFADYVPAIFQRNSPEKKPPVVDEKKATSQKK